MSIKLPKVIGHRGAAAYAPENTLEGLHTAADMGIEWVEVDVKLTKDGVPILFHDETLDRTTNGNGPVAEKDYEEIKQLEAGSWYGESFTGIKIPTLEEAVDVLLERDLGLNLEIKACPGREKETAEIALDQLSQIWDDHDRLYCSSYSMVSLEACMDMAPDWSRGIVLGKNCEDSWLEKLEAKSIPDDLEQISEHLQLTAVSIDGDFLSQYSVEALNALNLIPVPYRVNDENRARLFQSWGIQHMISDEPDIILENLLTVH